MCLVVEIERKIEDSTPLLPRGKLNRNLTDCDHSAARASERRDKKSYPSRRTWGKNNCKRPRYCQQDCQKKQKRCVPVNTFSAAQEGRKRIRSESYLAQGVTWLLREIDQILVGHFYTRYLKRSCLRISTHCPFFVDLHWIEYQDLV